MATPTPANAIWHYRINLARAGQQAMITTYLKGMGTPGTADYFDFCAGWLTAREGAFQIISDTKELLVSEWSIMSHVLQVVSPTRLVPFGRNFGGTPIPGTLAGTALPINTSAVIERATAQGNRSGQGTLKPPFGSSASSGDKATWSNTFLNLLQAWGDKMIALMPGALPGDDLKPVIWSSQPGFPTYEFRLSAPKPQLRTMSRRTVGRGI